MPLPAKTDVLGRENASHLLRRATFGFNKADVDKLANMTPQQAVAELFAFNRGVDLPSPLPPVYPGPRRGDDPRPDLVGKSWIEDKEETQPDGNDLKSYVLQWIMGQMFKSNDDGNIKIPSSVREKIVFFFHTLFTTKQDKVGRSRDLYYQVELFRFFAFDKLPPENWVPAILNIAEPTVEEQEMLDRNARQIDVRKPENINFKSLVEKVSLDNAMLRFLDGDQNIKGRINENYGREFLELYAIGKGLEGSDELKNLPKDDYFNYTEADVQAAAKVFTGYQRDDTYAIPDDLTGIPRVKFNIDRHDISAKTFSNRFQGKTVKGDTAIVDKELQAIDEIKQLVDLVFEQDQASRYICRKIYRFYVHSQITPEIENDVIAVMAESFKNSGFKFQAVLEELFQSVHFYNGKAGSIIKSPFDLVATTLNVLDIKQPDDQTEFEKFYQLMQVLEQPLQTTGLQFYEPFEVAGYTAYHQYPLYTRSWITPSYLTNRYSFIKSTLAEGDNSLFDFDIVGFVEKTFDGATASDAKKLVIGLCELFLPLSESLSFDSSASGADLTVSRLNFFLSAFLEQLPANASAEPGEEWTRYWGQKNEIINPALRTLFSSILESPEYQLF